MKFTPVEPEQATVEFYDNTLEFREPKTSEFKVLSKISSLKIEDQLDTMITSICDWYVGDSPDEFKEWLLNLPLGKLENLIEGIVEAFVEEDTPKKSEETPLRSRKPPIKSPQQ